MTTLRRAAEDATRRPTTPLFVDQLALRDASGMLKIRFLNQFEVVRHVEIELRRLSPDADRLSRKVGRRRFVTFLQRTDPVAGADPDSFGVIERIGHTTVGLALHFETQRHHDVHEMRLVTIGVGQCCIPALALGIAVRTRCAADTMSVAVTVTLFDHSVLHYSGELS